jgi:hypothetical protein
MLPYLDVPAHLVLRRSETEGDAWTPTSSEGIIGPVQP